MSEAKAGGWAKIRNSNTFRFTCFALGTVSFAVGMALVILSEKEHEKPNGSPKSYLGGGCFLLIIAFFLLAFPLLAWRPGSTELEEFGKKSLEALSTEQSLVAAKQAVEEQARQAAAAKLALQEQAKSIGSRR